MTTFSSLTEQITNADTKLLHVCQTMQFAIHALEAPHGEHMGDYAAHTLNLLMDATNDVRALLDEAYGMAQQLKGRTA